MAMVDRNISVNAARIRRLSEAASNRIAAGEVIERPAAAVKELVENALDAGARRIGVVIAGGGKTLIRVTDDGAGITAEDLALALERHATSKIDGSDLENIRSFGFRGEALASMGAVARLEIVSRAAGSSETWSIAAHGGAISPARPAAGGAGTTIELRDLFYAAPARLKFLRTDRAETQAVGDVMRRLAMAAPHVGFTLSDATAGAAREIFAAPVEAGDLFDARLARLRRIMGRAFAENAVAIEAEREGLRLGGWAGLPTFSRGSAAAQHLFVNGRPVRDRLLLGALRGAYADLLHGGRHPAAALYIECAPERVDVNVHPAKTEVRFREPGVARGLVVAGVRHALAEAGHRASTTVGAAALGAFHPEGAGASAAGSARPAPGAGRWRGPDRPGAALREAAASFFAPDAADAATVGAGAGAGAGSGSGGDPAGSADHGADGALSARVESGEVERAALARPLGAARAQLHETYIVAQTEDGIVIVDQHAAHERLVYERLKAARAAGGVARQALLIPEVVELGGDAERVLDIADDLAELGLAVEPFGAGAVCVRETPALLGPCDAAGLLRDVADELADLGATTALTARIDAVLSRIACHGSVRAGRRMGAVEMNALLREMEATPLSGQCNHGRPTYVSLRLSEIETLFGRR